MISITGLLLLVFGVAGVAAQAGAAGSEFRREAGNAIPKYPYDANTTRRCTWWYDSDGSLGCEDLDTVYGVSLVDFLQWVSQAALVLSQRRIQKIRKLTRALQEPIRTRNVWKTSDRDVILHRCTPCSAHEGI